MTRELTKELYECRTCGEQLVVEYVWGGQVLCPTCNHVGFVAPPSDGEAGLLAVAETE